MHPDAERLQIACVASVDPRSHGKNSMAHTLDNVARALQRRCGDVTFIGPMDARLERAAGKFADVCCRLVSHRRYMYFHGTWVARRFGRLGTRKLSLASRRFDVIVGGSAVDVGYLATDIPIVIALDATVTALRDYYPVYSHLTERSMRELDTTERTAIRKAALLLYSSQWAARSAIEDYGADPAKVHVLPFGADLDSPPPPAIVRDRVRSDHCRLLFLAVDWERKGGDIAVETLNALECMGVDAELVVCGCTPPPGVTHPRMRVIPFLDKRDARQRRALEALYRNSDFLLLPTRGDCTPIVVCEASAFGLPTVATDTGGVPELVSDGETGFLLPLDARGDAYAAAIAQAYASPVRCAALSRAARMRFDERLNWDAWARAASPLIAAIAGRAPVGDGASTPRPMGPAVRL